MKLRSTLWSNNGTCEKWHEANYPVFQISGKSFFQTNRIIHHKECLGLCCFICQQIQPWKKENRVNSLRKKHNARGTWGVVCGPLFTSEKFLCQSVSWTDFMVKPDRPVPDGTKSPCISRNLICGHLGDVLRPHYL